MSEHDHAHGAHDEGEHHDLPVAARVRRLEERLIAAGLASDEEIDAYLGKLYASASPVNGARMAARGWRPVTRSASPPRTCGGAAITP